MPEYFRNEVVGTNVLFQTDCAEGENLKVKNGIILRPQPSDSPNDPLNWSYFRKIWHAFLVLVVVGLTAATSNSASAAQKGLMDKYSFLTWQTFNIGAGVLFIGIGLWTLLSAPSVFLYGCRLNYLVGLIFGVIGCAWYANCENSGDVIASQLFMGASESVAEAVAQLSLSNIFFQHQLGDALGLYVFATSAGTFAGPIVGGFIAGHHTWNWVGWAGAIASGACFVLIFFGMEETYFSRNSAQMRESDEMLRSERPLMKKKSTNLGEPLVATQSPGDQNAVSVTECEGDEGDLHSRADFSLHSPISEETPSVQKIEDYDPELSNEKPRSYWKAIAVITPAHNIQGWGFKQYFYRLKHMLRVLSFPAVIYAGLQWGFQDGWLTFYITAEDDFYQDEPWNYGDQQIALMNVPSLIGAVIGCIYASWFSDWLVVWIAKRNKGIVEPEFRLYVMFLAAIISPLGMLLFGIGTEHKWPWQVMYVGLGFIGFGFGSCGDLSMSYLADCYPGMVLEGMVGVAVIHNILAMFFSFVCDTWLAIGPAKAFIIVAVLDFVVIMLSLPMIIYGKAARKRSTVAYYDFIKKRDSLDSINCY